VANYRDFARNLLPNNCSIVDIRPLELRSFGKIGISSCSSAFFSWKLSEGIQGIVSYIGYRQSSEIWFNFWGKSSSKSCFHSIVLKIFLENFVQAITVTFFTGLWRKTTEGLCSWPWARETDTGEGLWLFLRSATMGTPLPRTSIGHSGLSIRRQLENSACQYDKRLVHWTN